MRFSSVDALFEAPPRRSLPSNLSQLGIGRRANKKPRLIAGQGCVGSDTKLLCMRFCCRTGSTPRHPNTLSLFRYQYKDDFAASRRPALSTKHFLFRLQIKGISTHELNLAGRRLESPISDSGRSSGSPRPESFRSEGPERAAECEMALDVESVVDGGVNGQEALG